MECLKHYEQASKHHANSGSCKGPLLRLCHQTATERSIHQAAIFSNSPIIPLNGRPSLYPGSITAESTPWYLLSAVAMTAGPSWVTLTFPKAYLGSGSSVHFAAIFTLNLSRDNFPLFFHQYAGHHPAGSMFTDTSIADDLVQLIFRRMMNAFRSWMESLQHSQSNSSQTLIHP